MYKEIMHAINKYLELKKTCGAAPQLELLAVVIRKTGHCAITCQNNATTCKKDEHTQFHSDIGTQTHCALIFFSFNLF